MRYRYQLRKQLPLVCCQCKERQLCMENGFGDACCDECDYLLGCFELVPVEEDT